MKNIEVFNYQARETRGGGYKALEAEAIEASVARYNLEKEQERMWEEADYDPRIVATRAEQAAVGFDMQSGYEYSIK